MYQVENYGFVRQHQSDALNYHLEKMLESFDREYNTCGGQLGSLSHAYDRAEFAKITSESLIDSVVNVHGQITRTATKTEIDCPSLGKIISVESVSGFEPDNPDSLLDNVLHLN